VVATIHAEEAAVVRWDAVIVGAGPAGAATALRLAAGGWQVLLVDRGPMPRPKVCGCCLSGVASEELSHLGLSADRLGGVRRARVRVVAGAREAVLPLVGWTLSRESLDAGLVRRAIDAGATWLPGVDVLAIEDHAFGVQVSARDGDGRCMRLAAVHAVVAGGLGNRVRIVSDGGALPRPRAAHASRVGIGGTLPPAAMAVAVGELVRRRARRETAARAQPVQAIEVFVLRHAREQCDRRDRR
jgi:flavin-dependent dehydrogenase